MIVLNTSTLAVSEHNIPALDVATHQGVVYYLTSDAILKQDPSSDEKITPSIQTGSLALLSGQPFNLFKVIPFARAVSINITLHTKYRGQAVSYGLYTIIMDEYNEIREWLKKTARGHSGQAYAIELSMSGSFECRVLTVYVTPERHRT